LCEGPRKKGEVWEKVKKNQKRGRSGEEILLNEKFEKNQGKRKKVEDPKAREKP